jgi:hypothetical protein
MFLARHGKTNRMFNATMSYCHRSNSSTGFKPPHSLAIFSLILSSFLLLLLLLSFFQAITSKSFHSYQQTPMNMKQIKTNHTV